MPSQILHSLFGEDLFAELYRRIAHRSDLGTATGALKKVLETHRAAFILGCQGPDIFYHNQRRRPVALGYGSMLHRRDCGSFAAALLGTALQTPFFIGDTRAGEEGSGPLEAYALGFMTHPLLDRAAHPYIVYRSVPVSADSFKDPGFAKSFPRGRGAHPFFERIIDTLMLENLRGHPVSFWEGGTILASICEKPPPGLKELLAGTLAAVFPQRAGEDPQLSRRMDNTFKDCADFYHLTDPWQSEGQNTAYPRIPPVYLFPKKIPAAIDCLNRAHQSWRYPTESGRENNHSFPEIYQDAVQSAADLLTPIIVHYLSTGNFLMKATAEAIGNGGLSITDDQGKPCAPARTNPLPLNKILEDQIGKA